MRLTYHASISMALALSVTGCSPGNTILVQLKTDLAPGFEFSAAAVRTAPIGESLASAVPVVTAIFAGAPVADGVRIADFEGLTPGPHRVLVTLLDATEAVVVERPIIVEVDGQIGVTAVITRDCVGVSCRMDGAEACHGGTCTDPSCTPETPEACTTECESAAECPSLGSCASTRCDIGLCFYAPQDSECPAEERCDVERGCVPRLDRPSDSGPPDSGPPDSGPPDSGPPSDSASPDTGPADSGIMDTGITCSAGLTLCGFECLTSCETTFDAPMTTTYTVPRGCTRAAVRAWGAGGGLARSSTISGAGGFAQTTLDVTPSEDLTVVIGGPGGLGRASTAGEGGVPGGGGAGGTNNNGGGGGGGFSGVFRGTVAQTNALIVAGGGGGSGSRPGSRVSGAGGGVDGQDGTTVGSGGTQTAGGLGSSIGGRIGQPGSALQGGNGGTGGSDGGGGGGGGYYGGGAANNASSNAGGGGGGSGFITGTLPLLLAGSRNTPGNAADPDRGRAGDPAQPGAVVIECLR